jgi:hypothetical protein
MTIHIPRPLAIPLVAGLVAWIAAVARKEVPNLWRYAKFEGM